MSGSRGEGTDAGSMQEPTSPARRTRAPRVAKVTQDGTAAGQPSDTAATPRTRRKAMVSPAESPAAPAKRPRKAKTDTAAE